MRNYKKSLFSQKPLEKIAKIVADNQLTEITLEDGEQAITIRKDLAEVVTTAVAPVSAPSPVVCQTTVNTPVAEVATETPKGKAITSPMVGAFYAAPAPGAKPFVKVGDTVSTGQVVCIVEAMKLMNEIESEVSGKVVEICVEDGQSVEYGQVLMYVE